jgi:hypothetical protein
MPEPKTVTDVQARLLGLASATGWLSDALKAYQLALAKARSSGATWEQLGSAAGIHVSTARHRHRTAVQGGELHLHIDPLGQILEED